MKLANNNSVGLVEAQVASVDATFVSNITIDQSFPTHELDSSTHSIVYSPDFHLQNHNSRPSAYIDSSQIYGEEEGYGLPETEQEALVNKFINLFIYLFFLKLIHNCCIG